MKRIPIIIEAIDESHINIQEELSIASKVDQKDFVKQNSIGEMLDDKSKRTKRKRNSGDSGKGGEEPQT